MIADRNDQYDELMDDLDDEAEGSYGEDDWNSYEEPDSRPAVRRDTDPEPVRKKKSPLPGILLIVGILLAGGGFVFLKGGQQPAQEQPVMAEGWSAVPAAPVAPQMPENAAPPVEIVSAPVPPMPSAIAPAEPALDTQGVAGQSGVEEPAAASIRMPRAEDMLLKPPAVEPSAPASSSVAPEALSDISSRIDLLMARLDKIENDIAEIRVQPSANTDALQKSIRDLEMKVSSLTMAKPAASAPATAPANQPERAPSASPEPTILGSAPMEMEEAEREVRPARAVPPAPVEEVAAPNWILKGAQPGRAMVSRPGESEMRTVEVGSILSGVGQVVDISYQDGRWVVVGTKGRISQ